MLVKGIQILWNVCFVVSAATYMFMCQITAWVAFVFKNVLVMVRTQISSDCDNKVFLCSIHTAITRSFSTYLFPPDTHIKWWYLWYLVLFWVAMWMAVQPSVDDSYPHWSCCALTWEGLCMEEWRAACVSREWTAEQSVCTKPCSFTNQECQIVVHLFEGRLYIEVVNSLISVLYW